MRWSPVPTSESAFPRRPRPTGVTLSLPGGLDRALKRKRLPGVAEAFLAETETWVMLTEHPAVAALAASSDTPQVVEDGERAALLWHRDLHAVERWAAAL